MFSFTKSVMSRMLPLVTASPMCCESRIGMSKSVWRAANCVNIASCQLALGTVLTSMVTLGRSLVYSALAKSSSARAGGHSNQTKLRVVGSSESSGMVAGAFGPPAAAAPPPPSPSSPPPHAAKVVATRSAAVASRTFRPGRDQCPARFEYRICSPASCIGGSNGWCCARGSCWVRGLTGSPRRGDVVGLHELEEALRAAFAAEPALLGAAEGCGRVRDEAPVEPDHPALHLLCQTQAASEVGGVEVA